MNDKQEQAFIDLGHEAVEKAGAIEATIAEYVDGLSVVITELAMAREAARAESG